MRPSTTLHPPLKCAALMSVLLCLCIGACQQSPSQPSGETENPTTEALDPSQSNTGASTVTEEQNNTAELENPSEVDTEACCENDDPPNAVADEVLPTTEVLPTAENEAEQRINEHTETEEE